MTRLGRYALGPLLGEGGEGQVYEAELIGPGGLRRPVALKVLHEGADSLRREARIGGLLRHRHLVDVYEVNEADGRWFCALEKCAGSLVSHIPLPPRAVVEVGLAVCAALQYAQEDLGLVHLDLKPANLLVAADGTVKVADLGIARARGFEGDGIRGTPAYMPPEQFGGGAVDTRSDIYALGITLLELATGSRSQASATQDFSLADEDSTLDLDTLDGPVGTARAKAPDWLLPIVDRCTQELPSARYPSMGALAEALGALRVEGPGLASVLGIPPETQRSVGTAVPRALDRFVGREREVEALRALLAQPGLVTVRGPAGVGKSRLCEQVASDWSAAAWMVGLSEVQSVDGLVYAVAQALEVPVAKRDPVQKLGHALAGRGPVLLVLDTFEHLSGLGPVLERWVAAAPELRLLVTSQRPVGVDGERSLALEPLDEGAAVALLASRARIRGVDVSGDPDLPELARRLEGLPLALELAAGRLGVLSVRDVLDRLGLGLLRAAEQGRHGTLRAALAWSWEQLDAAERERMVELSVFSGSFTVEAAEQVCAGDGVLDGLDRLIDGSMVVARAGERFGLLASVREFAAEQGDRSAARARHGAVYGALGSAEHLDRLLRHGGVARRRELAAELDNLLAAHRWAVETGDPGVAAATALAAFAVLELSGPVRAALPLLEQARALVGPTGERAAALATAHGRALHTLGRVEEAVGVLEGALEAVGDRPGAAELRRNLGDFLRALGRLEEAQEQVSTALGLARTSGDRMTEAKALSSLATLVSGQGNPDEAEALEGRAVVLYEDLGNTVARMYQLANIGILHHRRAELEQAEAKYAQALALAEEVGAPEAESWVLHLVGTVHLNRGRYDDARVAFERSLAGHRAVGSRSFEGTTVAALASLAVHQKRHDDALGHFEEALAIAREIDNPEGEAITRANLGQLYQDLGRTEDAVATYEQALGQARSLGNGGLEGHVCHRLGGLLRRSGEAERARALLTHGEARLRAIRYREELGYLLVETAHLLVDDGDRAGAEARLAEAETVSADIGGEASELAQGIARVRERMARNSG